VDFEEGMLVFATKGTEVTKENSGLRSFALYVLFVANL
jgi:hypothetical protein